MEDRPVRYLLYTFSNVTADHTISASFAINVIGIGTPPNGTGSTASLSPQGPASLSNIQVQSASLSMSRVAPGAAVTVTADVMNKGTADGSAQVKLYVDGQEEAHQGVALASGKRAPVRFTVSREGAGYLHRLCGQCGCRQLHGGPVC